MLLPCLAEISVAEGILTSSSDSAPLTSHQAHWAYMGIDGPEHWGMLDAGYMVCENGREQSPIDVKTSQHSDPPSSLVFHYQSSPVHVVNNSHTVQVNYKAGSMVLFNGQKYELPSSLLTANPIDRYLINSPMLPDLKPDPDGGVTIYIQHKTRGKEEKSNWLPAPEGPFWLVLRLYSPKEEAISGKWIVPKITKVK